MSPNQSTLGSDPTIAQTASTAQVATDPTVTGARECIMDIKIPRLASPVSIWKTMNQNLQRGGRWVLGVMSDWVWITDLFWALSWSLMFAISLLCFSHSLKYGKPRASSAEIPPAPAIVAAPVNNWVSWLSVIAIFQTSSVIAFRELTNHLERKKKEWEAERQSALEQLATHVK